MISFKDETLYTITEATKLLNKSYITLYRWRRHGLIKVVKIGQSVYIKENEVNRIMEGGNTLKNMAA